MFKRKIVLMSESDRAAFYRFCEAIQNVETDKDAFLTAARLSRQESGQKLTQEQEYWLRLVGIWSRVIALFLIGFFVVCLRGCQLGG